MYESSSVVHIKLELHFTLRRLVNNGKSIMEEGVEVTHRLVHVLNNLVPNTQKEV